MPPSFNAPILVRRPSTTTRQRHRHLPEISADVQCHQWSGGNSGFAINFNGFSSAGTAKFILGQVVDTNNGFNAGFINFQDSSTAGQATITTRDASATNFNNSSNAGQATLIVEKGGFVGFNDQSSGAQATVINNAGGEVGYIWPEHTPEPRFGSIAGAGTFTLGSKALTVGSNNTLNGGQRKHHRRWRIAREGGHGTLTLSGDNTYTGGTTINAGTLAVNGSLASGVTVQQRRHARRHRHDRRQLRHRQRHDLSRQRSHRYPQGQRQLHPERGLDLPGQGRFPKRPHKHHRQRHHQRRHGGRAAPSPAWPPRPTPSSRPRAASPAPTRVSSQQLRLRDTVSLLRPEQRLPDDADVLCPAAAGPATRLMSAKRWTRSVARRRETSARS